MSRKFAVPHHWGNRVLALMVACMLPFLLILVAETANQGSRPITSGPINQTYLWTAETIIGGNTFLPQGALICLGLVPAIGLAACWLPTEGWRG